MSFSSTAAWASCTLRKRRSTSSVSRSCASSPSPRARAAKPGLEELILPERPEALRLAANSPALHLIQRIRDEAHRFAITGHRARRAKARITSGLETIEGLGPARRRALLTTLGGLAQVKRASVEDLARVEGISRKLAERIYAYLH
jgi:excinuclease ABC subunit C